MTNFDIVEMRNTVEYNKALIKDLAVKGLLDFVFAKKHLENLKDIEELYTEIIARNDIVDKDAIFASHKHEDKLNSKMTLKLLGEVA
jgi:hypothetical protein